MTSTSSAQTYKSSAKLCLKGFCTCKTKLVDAGGRFRLENDLVKRVEELKHIFPGGRNAIDGVALAELLGQRHS